MHMQCIVCFIFSFTPSLSLFPLSLSSSLPPNYNVLHLILREEVAALSESREDRDNWGSVSIQASINAVNERIEWNLRRGGRKR